MKHTQSERANAINAIFLSFVKTRTPKKREHLKLFFLLAKPSYDAAFATRERETLSLLTKVGKKESAHGFLRKFLYQ